MMRVVLALLLALALPWGASAQTQANDYPSATPVLGDEFLLIDDPAGAWAMKNSTLQQVMDLFEANWQGPAEIGVAASDETTDLTTGTAKVTFRMPYAMTLTAVRASVTTAPVGSVITVDLNESGTTVLSTKVTIDAGEKTSETALTEEVISDSALADDAEITVDIDQVGSSTAGTGLKVWLIGTRS